MRSSRSHRRARLAAVTSVVLAFTGLQLFAPPAAQADVSTKIATFPYSQDWSNGGLITVNNDWSGVTGIQGYLGQDITTVDRDRPADAHGRERSLRGTRMSSPTRW